MGDTLRQRFYNWQQDLELCIEELFRRDGYLEPLHMVMNQQGDLSILSLAPYLDSPQAEDLLRSLMLKHIQGKNAVASALVAESWLVKGSKEQLTNPLALGKSPAEHPSREEVVSVDMESFWETTTILYTINRQGKIPHLGRRREFTSPKNEDTGRLTQPLRVPFNNFN